VRSRPAWSTQRELPTWEAELEFPSDRENMGHFLYFPFVFPPKFWSGPSLSPEFAALWDFFLIYLFLPTTWPQRHT
jgi:hypothetical protein